SASRQCRLKGGVTVTVCATAKGAGMIRPDMATMLCFVCTDLSADAKTLSGMLSVAVDRSFNRITVDGDTSTNDTVFLMANGACGAGLATDTDRKNFQQALDEVLMDLARLMVRDGEGATKLIEVRVTGARSEADARRVADTVAGSSLVKTAFFGQDANWGRILAAAGRSGADLSPDAVDIFFDDVQMVKSGMGCGPEAEKKASEVLKKDTIGLRIDLNTGGAGEATVFTCDLTIDYVKINADYRT
ncbi:MAG: bifunctional ornithine acetyltransferase/N-acetylglutamate synthase, partial [Thermodesulfobacteriota bacterium]